MLLGTPGFVKATVLLGCLDADDDATFTDRRTALNKCLTWLRTHRDERIFAAQLTGEEAWELDEPVEQSVWGGKQVWSPAE